MRLVTVIAALLLGMVGLLMSLCGGGFLLTLAYSAFTNSVGSGHPGQLLNGLTLLVLPAAFLAGGVLLCRWAWRFLRHPPP